MRTLALITLISLLSGCKTLSNLYLPADVFEGSPTEIDYLTPNNTIDISKIGSFDDYDGQQNKQKRNALIARAILLSDQKCALHKAGILSNATTWNVGTSSIAILLSGAASVVNNARAASNLAAAAGATTGIQSTVTKEIYANALATTILRAIDSARSQRKAAIEKGINESDYPLAIALNDIQSYHDACSMMTGLIEVTKSIDNRKPSRQEIERDIQFIKNESDNLKNNSIGNNSDNQKILDDIWSQKIKDLMNSPTN